LYFRAPSGSILILGFFSTSEEKKAFEILIVITLNLQIPLGSMDTLEILIFQIHKHRMLFHLIESSSIYFITVLRFRGDLSLPRLRLFRLRKPKTTCFLLYVAYRPNTNTAIL
jgi:hypothetical protein